MLMIASEQGSKNNRSIAQKLIILYGADEATATTPRLPRLARGYLTIKKVRKWVLRRRYLSNNYQDHTFEHVLLVIPNSSCHRPSKNKFDGFCHGLRTPREEIAFTARPKIHSQSQIFRYGRSIFCLPHWPNFSDIFDLCLHWVSIVRGISHPCKNWKSFSQITRRIHNVLEILICSWVRFHKKILWSSL